MLWILFFLVGGLIWAAGGWLMLGAYLLGGLLAGLYVAARSIDHVTALVESGDLVDRA